MSEVNIKHSVVFVTGANRGIGRAITEEALARGAKKVYAAARDTASLDPLVEEYPDRVVPIRLDVTDAVQIEEAAELAADTEILVNNAGVAAYSGFVYGHDKDGARREIETNYFAPMNVTRAFAKSLIDNGNGAVATLVSVSGLTSFPQVATYSASKAAAHSLTQGLRAELGPSGVSVFGIYPGPIDTDMSSGLDMQKESPRNAAIRIFEQMEQGVEDITTDALADDLVALLRVDAKAVERENAKAAHTA